MNLTNISSQNTTTEPSFYTPEKVLNSLRLEFSSYISQLPRDLHDFYLAPMVKNCRFLKLSKGSVRILGQKGLTDKDQAECKFLNPASTDDCIRLAQQFFKNTLNGNYTIKEVRPNNINGNRPPFYSFVVEGFEKVKEVRFDIPGFHALNWKDARITLCSDGNYLIASEIYNDTKIVFFKSDGTYNQKTIEKNFHKDFNLNSDDEAYLINDKPQFNSQVHRFSLLNPSQIEKLNLVDKKGIRIAPVSLSVDRDKLFVTDADTTYVFDKNNLEELCHFTFPENYSPQDGSISKTVYDKTNKVYYCLMKKNLFFGINSQIGKFSEEGTFLNIVPVGTEKDNCSLLEIDSESRLLAYFHPSLYLIDADGKVLRCEGLNFYCNDLTIGKAGEIVMLDLENQKIQTFI